MAGHKGFGLGLAAELLAGILTGYGASHMPEYVEGNGAFILVVDVNRFVPQGEFGANADAFFRHVKATPTDADTDEILIPGEIEYRTREQREREGIPVNEAVWDTLTAAAERLGVHVE